MKGWMFRIFRTALEYLLPKAGRLLRLVVVAIPTTWTQPIGLFLWRPKLRNKSRAFG